MASERLFFFFFIVQNKVNFNPECKIDPVESLGAISPTQGSPGKGEVWVVVTSNPFNPTLTPHPATQRYLHPTAVPEVEGEGEAGSSH